MIQVKTIPSTRQCARSDQNCEEEVYDSPAVLPMCYSQDDSGHKHYLAIKLSFSTQPHSNIEWCHLPISTSQDPGL